MLSGTATRHRAVASVDGLLRSVPEKLAMELLLTGRRVYGPEAARIGLITRAIATEALDTAVGEILDGDSRQCIAAFLDERSAALSAELRK